MAKQQGMLFNALFLFLMKATRINLFFYVWEHLSSKTVGMQHSCFNKENKFLNTDTSVKSFTSGKEIKPR